MKYAIRDHAGLPSIGLEKIYCYVPCKCAFYRHVYFPEFEIVLFHNSTQFTEFPSPAQRAACRLTPNADRPIWKNLAKMAGCCPGRSLSSSACLPLSAMGKNSRSAKPQRLYPHPNPRQNSHFLKGVDVTALQGGREGISRKNTCKSNFAQNYAKILQSKI